MTKKNKDYILFGRRGCLDKRVLIVRLKTYFVYISIYRLNINNSQPEGLRNTLIDI
jgi:hypothetical protein